MKSFFTTPKKPFLLTLFIVLALISFYSAIAIGNSPQTKPGNTFPAEPDDRPAGFESEKNHEPSPYLQAIALDAFAEAKDRARMSPLSPITSGREFSPLQVTNDSLSSGWINPVPPPIRPDPPWNNDILSGRITALAFDATDSSVVYAGGLGGFFRGTYNGASWTWSILSNTWQSQAVSAIAIDPDGIIYVGTGNLDTSRSFGTGLYRSLNGGITWDSFIGACPTCNPPATNLFNWSIVRGLAIDPNVRFGGFHPIYVGIDRFTGSSGGVFRSTDRGMTWTLWFAEPCPSPPSDGCDGVFGVAIDSLTTPSTLYLADVSGVWKNVSGDNDPSHWQHLFLGYGNHNSGWRTRLIVVNPHDGRNYSIPYFLGPGIPDDNKNRLYYSENADTNWTQIKTLCADGRGDGCYAAGDEISPEVLAVDPFDRRNIVIGAIDLFRTTVPAYPSPGPSASPISTTWQSVRGQANFLDLHVDQRSLLFSDTVPHLVYVGNDGGIWRSPQAGTQNTWSNLNDALPGMWLLGVAVSQGSIMGGTFDNGPIFYDAQSGTGEWKQVWGGDSFSVLIDPANNSYSYFTINYITPSNPHQAHPFFRYIRSQGFGDISPAVDCTNNAGTGIWSMSVNELVHALPHITTACRWSVYRTWNARVSPVTWQQLGDVGAPFTNFLSAAFEAPSDPRVVYASEDTGAVIRRTKNAPDLGIPGTTPTPGATWFQGRVHTDANHSCSRIDRITVDPTNADTAYLVCKEMIFKTTSTSPDQDWYPTGATPNLYYHDLVIDPLAPSHIIAASDTGVRASTDGGASWGVIPGIPDGMIVTTLWLDASVDPAHPGPRQLAASTKGRGVYLVNLDQLPAPGLVISGAAVFCSSPSLTPLSSVIMTLTGSGSGSTSTDDSGQYSLAGLVSEGSYTVTPAKAALPPASFGINTVDVIAVQRHFLNIGSIPPGCRLAAADVNGDNSITTVDVIAVQRFFLALTSGTANTGNHQFVPASRSYSGITNNQTNQNYDTLVFGDVASPFVH